jgi:hypothetical protein
MPSTCSSSKNQVARAEDSQDNDDGIIESDASEPTVMATTNKRPRMRKSRNEDLFEDDDDDDEDEDDDDLLDGNQAHNSSTSGKKLKAGKWTPTLHKEHKHACLLSAADWKLAWYA